MRRGLCQEPPGAKRSVKPRHLRKASRMPGSWQVLERGWQVIANEFYDATGRFSQEWWAEQLQATLRGAGGTLPDTASLDRALDDMIGSLGDRYTTFLRPAEWRKAISTQSPAELVRRGASGWARDLHADRSFGPRGLVSQSYATVVSVGPGLLLGSQETDGTWSVQAPVPESPAEAAGILRGDRLLAVDGVRMAPGISAANAKAMLRGPIGSTVTLTVADRQTGLSRTVELERRPLPQPPLREATIATDSGDWLRYIRIHYFNHETTGQLETALRRGEREHVAGYVLDLRNNPGGTLEETVLMASMFLDCDKGSGDPGAQQCDIVSTYRNGRVPDQRWRADSLPHEARALGSSLPPFSAV